MPVCTLSLNVSICGLIFCQVGYKACYCLSWLSPSADVAGCSSTSDAFVLALNPVPVVLTINAVSGSVDEAVDFTGKGEEVKSVTARPRVTGYAQLVHFKLDAMMKKDAVLIVLDDRNSHTVIKRATLITQREVDMAKLRYCAKAADYLQLINIQHDALEIQCRGIKLRGCGFWSRCGLRAALVKDGCSNAVHSPQ